MKTYTELTEAGLFVATIGVKTTLVNTGTATAFLTDDQTDQAQEGLSNGAKKGVLTALHSLKAGEAKALTAGSYNITFLSPAGRSLVVVVETKEKKAEPEKKAA